MSGSAVGIGVVVVGLCGVALSSCPGASDVGSERMIARDGVELWTKVAGVSDAHPIIVLHGGPGDNTSLFERSVGKRLQRSRQMVYFDQRGSGRSSLVDEDLLGMDDLLLDLEQIRRELRFDRVSLIGHSFGGLLALEYLARYPDRVAAIVLIDVTPDLAAVVKRQVEFAAEEGERLFPEHRAAIRAIRGAGERDLTKLGRLYELIGARRLVRLIQFPSDESFQRAESWGIESGLRGRSRGRVMARLTQDGYFDSAHPELMRRVPVPIRIFAGRKSHVVGEELLKRAAEALGAEIVWFEESGHYPYLDEPDRFAEETVDFLRGMDR